MYVHQEGIRARAPIGRTDSFVYRHSDRFAELVRRVAADTHNPFNIERYLWVLEEPPLRACATCGTYFDPWFGYDGEAPHGPARCYCSRRCAGRAAYERQRARLGRRCGAPYWQLGGSLQPCRACGKAFSPAVTYGGAPIRAGRRRSFCSPECQAQWATRIEQRGERWGSAA